MSAVGIVTIALGVLGVCESGAPLVAPEAYFGWLKEMIASNARIRMLGAFGMALGGAMVWASTSEDSVLGTFLTIFGWVCLVISGPLLVLLPGDTLRSSPATQSIFSRSILGRCWRGMARELG